MKFYTFLNEIFDSDIDLNVISSTKKLFKTEFFVDGKLYFFKAVDDDIAAKYVDNGYFLSFGFGKDDKDQGKYKLTNFGNSFKVLSGVKKSISLFLKKYNLDNIIYIAEGKEKENIYNKLMKDFGMTMTHKVDVTKDFGTISGRTPTLLFIWRV